MPARIAVLLVAAVVAVSSHFHLANERQAAERLRAEVSALRKEQAVRRSLLGEGKRWSGKGPPPGITSDPVKRPRLATDTDARQRVPGHLASQGSPTPASVNPAAGNPNAPFTARGKVALQPGESLITGGWRMRDGKRGFQLLTPALQTSPDGSALVVIESRLFALPEAALTAAGLHLLLADGREADHHGVADAARAAGLLRHLEQTADVDFLSAPKVATSAGAEARISIGGEADGGMQMRLLPRLSADGRGVELEFDSGLSPAAQSIP